MLSGPATRRGVLLALVLGPLAFGAVHEVAWAPLLLLCLITGWASWARNLRPARSPGGRFAVALALLTAVQLVPLPPFLLRLVSPGSYAFHADWSLVPLRSWHPISVSPADTLRGLAFVVALGAFHVTVAREFGPHPVRRRRLVGVVVGVALFATAVGLAQAAAGTDRIYGLWKPGYSGALFGPYVNKNHFAGYVAMAVPLALALAARRVAALGEVWSTRRRRARWLALGDPEGVTALAWIGLVLLLVIGLLAARSRGGLLALLAAFVALAFSLRRRVLGLALTALVALLAVAWVGPEQVTGTLGRSALGEGRLQVWRDSARMAGHFPVFGSGLNTFGTAYPRYQRVDRAAWWGEAHNDYLQALYDTGLIGLWLLLRTLARLLRAARRAAERGSLEAGVFASLLASCAHALVDFDWQIPANALTFVALAALVPREPPIRADHVDALLESGAQPPHPTGE